MASLQLPKLPPQLRGRGPVVLGVGAAAVIFVAMRARPPVDSGPLPSGGAPVSDLDPATLAALLSGAQGQGAAAAIAGFGPGAELGAAGLATAGQAFDTAAGLAGYALDANVSIGAAGIGLAQQLGQGLIELLPAPLFPTLPQPTLPPQPVVTTMPIGTPTPIPTAPIPTAPRPTAPIPTAPRPTAPAPLRYRIVVSHGAVVRSYRLSSAGCIVSWTNRTWTAATSSAGASKAVHRDTCDGKSGAMTTRVTSGAFAGQTIRVGSGVSLQVVA